MRREDGESRWFHLRAVPARGDDGRFAGWVGTCTDIDDSLHDGQARENQRFLAEAGQLLSSSLRYDQTIRRVADLAVPRIADWCAVDLIDVDGELRALAIAHVDPAKVSLVRQLLDEYPDDPEEPTGSLQVVRSGEPILASEIPEEALLAIARDERHKELLAGLELRSYMCVPLRAGDRILGALALASSTPARQFGPEDLVFAETLAASASAAIENARLYREADRFRLILDSVVEAIVVFDPVSHVIDEVNLGARELLGRSRDELIGQRYETLLKPAEAARVPAIVGPLVSGERRPRRSCSTTSIPTGTGGVEVVLQPVDLPGSHARSSRSPAMSRDRIEVQVRLQRLAQAEHARAAELNAVIRAMGEAVVVCAADGTITLTNPAGERLFPDVDERTYAEILDQLNDPDGRAALGGVRRTGRDPDHGGPGALDRARDLSGHHRGGQPAERRRDDRGHARRDRGTPTRGRPRDVHRRPVARTAHAGHHDLRWRQAAGAIDVDARRGHPTRDLPRHP